MSSSDNEVDGGIAANEVDDQDASLQSSDAPKKRKLSQDSDAQQESSRTKKIAKSTLIDDEAEESEEDDEGDDEDGESDNDGEGEQSNDYVLDGFVVAEEEERRDKSSGKKSNGKEKRKLKRLVKGKTDLALDDEDYDLIRLNQGQEEDRQAEGSVGDGADDSTREIAPMMVNESDDDDNSNGESSRRKYGYRPAAEEDDEASEMSGFIVKDDYERDPDDEEREGGDTAGGERRRSQKGSLSGGKGKDRGKGSAVAALRRSKREGPTTDQIQEAMDIFGAGYYLFEDEDDEDGKGDRDRDQDRDGLGRDYLDDAAGEAAGLVGAGAESVDRRMIDKMRARYERSQIVLGFCTDRDEVVRRTDRPERMQALFEDRAGMDDEERKEEAVWISAKLAETIAPQRVRQRLAREAEARAQGRDLEKEREKKLEGLVEEGEKEAFLAAEELQRAMEDVGSLSELLQEPVYNVLRFLQVEDLEVPFIWTYRKDYLLEALQREHLWQIGAMDEQWERLRERKQRLLQEVQALCDSAEGISDADELLPESVERNISRLREARAQAQEALDDAQRSEQDAMNLVDEKYENAETPSVEDTNRVVEATAAKNILQEALDVAEAEVQQAEAQQRLLLQRMARKALYNPVAAREVLEQFHRDQYVQIIKDSTDEVEVRDVGHFLGLLIRGADAMAGLDDLGRPITEDSHGASASAAKRRTAGRRDEYRKYKRIRSLQSFLQMVVVPVCDFGESLRQNKKQEPPATPATSCLEAARSFVDDKLLRDAEMVMKAAILVVATELSFEPTLRSRARAVFRSSATVSTQPTALGRSTINPFHECFGLHYLDKKPARDFLSGADRDRTLFLKLIEAEKTGLLTVSIEPKLELTDKKGKPATDLSIYLQENLKLIELFMPTQPAQYDVFPETRQSWDVLRLEMLKACMEKVLLPSLVAELKRELLKVGREAVVEEAARCFERKLSVGPFQPPQRDHREYIKDMLLSCPYRPSYPSVTAVYFSASGDEPMFFAHVDKDGVLRAHDLLPSKASSQKKERLKAFILQNRPDLVVLNVSGGQSSRSTALMIEKEVFKEVAQELEQLNHLRKENRHSAVYGPDARSRPRGFEDEDEDDFMPYTGHVLLMQDEVANVFKKSARARRLLPDLQQGAAAAVCLARFAQEPLAEYCSMWTSADSTEVFGFETLFLDLHPLKSALKGNKLLFLRALEQRLVDAVCEVGVDLNKAVAHEHLSAMLAFVGGMGLRKAAALRQNIQRSVGLVDSRKVILEKKLLGRVVWTNAIGFLKITDAGLGIDRVLDPLDNTRIHPECYVTYDFAPKICADALEVDNNPADYIEVVERLMKFVRKDLEIRVNKHPRWLDLWETGRPKEGVTHFEESFLTRDGAEHKVEIELNDSLYLLELDDYAKDVEHLHRQGRRRLQLEQIKEELRFPWLDLRPSVQQVDPNHLFRVLTGETDHSLYVGLKVGCTVVEVSDSKYLDERTETYKQRQRATVRLDSGMRGSISMFDVTEERINPASFNMKEFLQPGMRIMAVVIAIKKDRLQVDLSIKPSILAKSEAWWMENRSTDPSAQAWWRLVGRSEPFFDPYFLEQRALAEYRRQEKSPGEGGTEDDDGVTERLHATSMLDDSENNNNENRADGEKGSKGSSSSKTAGRTMRSRLVHHPLFANVDTKGAIQKFEEEGKGAGDVIIRPSSKGPDYLTITWAVREGSFKHISVLEKGKRAGDMVGLGDELHILEDDIKEPFSDLDEIYSRFIEPLNDNVSAMTKNKYFIDGTIEEVEQELHAKLDANPDRIPYALRWEPSLAGYFVLTFINKRSRNPVKKELINVRPNGYLFRGVLYHRPTEVINAFKAGIGSSQPSQQQEQQQQPSSLPHRPSRFHHRQDANAHAAEAALSHFASQGAAPAPPPARVRPSRFQPADPPPSSSAGAGGGGMNQSMGGYAAMPAPMLGYADNR